MNISCDIIRDILPLYAEDMVSPATRELVDTHLCGCDACTKVLGQMLKREKIPAEVELDSLHLVKDKIRKRRWLAQLLVFFLTAALAVGLFVFLTRPIYLTASEAEIRIVEEDGKLVLRFGEAVDCYYIEGESAPGEGTTYTITAYRRLWNVHYGNMLDARYTVVGQDYPFSFGLESTRILYSGAPLGEEATVLWGEPLKEHYVVLPRLVLGCYFLMAGALGVVLLVLAWAARKGKAGRILRAGAGLPLSFCASVLIATRGNWRIYEQSEMPTYLLIIGLLALLLWAAWLCGWKYVEISRAEP